MTNSHPDADELSQILRVAVDAAHAGGEVLMRYLRDGVAIRDKSSDGGKRYDLVTDADFESEAVIAKTIAAAFPDHELLGEESLSAGRVDADHLWIIDPLDGTNNFAHQVPHFAVSIAYYRHGTPLAGVVWNPAREDRFTATAGGGAFHNGNPVRVSDDTGLTQSMIGCGFYYDRGEMMRQTLKAVEAFFGQEIHGIRRFGTAALDLCFVGCGQFGGYFEYQLSPWDFAAGLLFVREAGGRVTTALGDDVPLAKTSLVASNGTLHDSMLAITREHFPRT